ncbi:MAG: hypothetical protein Q7W30_01850 [Coriobacteriia bacterium]|nr:hypothetical protein [Coriobacteriia bacterium]
MRMRGRERTPARRRDRGLVGAIAGVGIAIVLARWRPTSEKAVRAAASLVACVLPAALAVAAWFAAGALTSAAAVASAITSGRALIWRAVLARVLERPVLGLGPDQITAVQSWQGTPAGELIMTSTADGHGVMVALAAAGGGLGLVAAMAVIGTIAYVLLDAHRRRGLPLAGAVLVGGASGLFVASLAAWAYAPAVLLAVAVTAPLASAAIDEDRSAPRMAGAVATAFAAVLTAGAIAVACVWLAVPFPLEIAGATAQATGATDATASAAAYDRWPDPLFAARAIRDATAIAASAPGAAASDRLLALAERVAPDARWGVDAALGRIVAIQYAGASAGRDTSTTFASAVSDAKRADRASGLWDYAATLEALRLGDTRLARRCAREALRFPQTEPNRLWLEGLAGGAADPARP